MSPLQRATLHVLGYTSDFLKQTAELRRGLCEAERLHAGGSRVETVAALSNCCSLEYEATGDTTASSELAQAFGLEDALAEYEEKMLSASSLDHTGCG